MRLLTRQAQQEMDQYFIAHGIPLILLMESAGTALAANVLAAYHRENFSRVDLLLGPGMNGADLYVCARKLAAKNIPLRIFEDPKLRTYSETQNAAIYHNRKAVLGLNLETHDLNDYRAEQALLVDGLLGTGYIESRELTPVLSHAFTEMAEAKSLGAYLIACDIPSGINANTGYVSSYAVKANETVSFIAPKLGQLAAPGTQYNGHLYVANLDLPAQLAEKFWTGYEELDREPPIEIYSLETAVFQSKLSEVNSDTHKYKQGNLLIISGSEGMSGSTLLAAQAAAKSGIGMLHIMTTKSVYQDLFPLIPQAIYHASDNTEQWLNSIENIQTKLDAILIGPGLGLTDHSKNVLAKALTIDLPLLIDADAITLIAKDQELFVNLKRRTSATILTPHAGEAKRLAMKYLDAETWQNYTRIEQILSLAQHYRAYILLKGEASLCTDPETKMLGVNTTGGPGLAKGGSGDILAGVVASLLAQGFSAFEAMQYGMYWHGLAGDQASEAKHWRSHLPLDTVEYLGKVLLHRQENQE